MIEIKAESVTKDGERGVQLTCSLEGTGREIVNEALISIRAIIAGVRNEDEALYAMMMLTILHDKSVLRGEMDGDERKDEAALGLADLMSKAIIKKGVN